jgi:RHS repeat-associated protein
MTGLRTQTMGYDAESRMISWADSSTGATVVLGYDGDGRRVTKTSSSGTTVYVYDPAGNLAVEYGGTPPAASGTLYLTQDHLGSTRLVTNSAGCVGAHDYLPFGEEIPSTFGRGSVPCYGQTDTAVKFTGKERDAETGLDYFGARYFSGAQGRFTSPDAPFNDQDPSNPQSWNLYSYGRNNPLAFIDPDGTTTCDANGNNCHDDVTVSGDSDPVDYVWSFLQSAGSQAVQNAVNATNTALTAVNNFRNSSNCTGAVTAAGAAAGAGIGAQAGSDIGAAAGAGLGTFALPGGGTIGGGVIGFGVGGGIGGAIGYRGGSALGGFAASVFCNGNAGPGSGGGGGESAGSAQAKKLSPSEIRKLESSTGESAHQIKTEALGTNKSIAQYDLYKDTRGMCL